VTRRLKKILILLRQELEETENPHKAMGIALCINIIEDIVKRLPP
jgi:hypothetical protein